MRFWKNSVKKAKLSHVKSNFYYFMHSGNGATYLLRQDLQGAYHFEVGSSYGDAFDEWETTQENIDELVAKIAEFKKIFEEAKQEKGGFIAVRLGESATLYYKHEQRERYHFLLENGAHVYCRKVSAREFLHAFKPMFLSVCMLREDEFVGGKSPLYVSAVQHDEYLAAEMEYFVGKATKQTIAVLNRTQKSPIFFAEKEIYDEADVTEITDIQRGKVTFFNRRAHYHFNVCIGGVFYEAAWRQFEQELTMRCQGGTVKITERLHEKLKVLTGETSAQYKTRALLQLENYLYCSKDGISKLPLEQRLKILNDLSQVRFDDLKALPTHHLARLTLAQLYDWLHCSGNMGNPDAIAFVENLAKLRKGNNQ